MKICIIGASGKLGQYMLQHAITQEHEIVCVCRQNSVHKLEPFKDRVTLVPGNTNDREVIKKAVQGCDGVLTVLVPWGIHHYASGTAQAVLDFAPDDARLIFSCGWHITRDGKDTYSKAFLTIIKFAGWIARLTRFADINDQVEACRRIFQSDAKWTVVRGSDLEEGSSQGLPVWSEHIGDPILQSNITRRIDFALFMIEALKDDTLIQQAPAIVSQQSESALAHSPEAYDNQ